MKEKLKNLINLKNSLKNKIFDFFTFFNDVEIYAASLSFYTLSAIVPMIIISLSIILHMPNISGKITIIKNLIISNLTPTNVDVVTLYIDSFMKNSQKLSMSAFIYAIFASILFFRNLENIASKLFESKKRGFFDALITYWALITLFPLGIGISLYFSNEAKYFLKMDFIILLDLLPYLIMWILFFILFKILANKPLPFSALVLSSFITMIAWHLTRWAFVYYVFFNKAYTTLYGSFSILMFFILWIYCFWIIILYGMRLTQGFITNFKGENNIMV